MPRDPYKPSEEADAPEPDPSVEIKSRVIPSTDGPAVLLHFDRTTNSLTLSPEQAKSLAGTLLNLARSADG